MMLSQSIKIPDLEIPLGTGTLSNIHCSVCLLPKETGQGISRVSEDKTHLSKFPYPGCVSV